jgi:hypothetical protein
MSTMRRLTAAMSPTARRARVSLLALLGGVLALSPALGAQAPPPINGITGTIVTEGTIVQERVAVNTIAVKTRDGVEHLFHSTKGLFVHGGKDGGVEEPQGPRESTPVVAHDAVAGSAAPAMNSTRAATGD